MTMPAPRKARAGGGEDGETPAKAPARKGSAASKAAASKAEADEPTAPPAEATRPDEEDREEVEVPMNRAARRAKGKVTQQSRQHGPVQVGGGKGPAHTHRMWANRRTG